MITRDLAVVGAGPAGLTCAWLAAAAGLTVIVLEAQPFPPRKTCAGGLPEKALKLLPSVAADAVVCQSLTAAILRIPGQRPFRFQCETPLVHSVYRERLSAILAEAVEAAGARIAPGSKVIAVRRAGQRQEVVAQGIGSIRAEIVVGCYGSRPAAEIGLMRLRNRPTRLGVAGFVPSRSLASLHESWQTVDCMLSSEGLLSFAFPMEEGYRVGVLLLRPTLSTSAMIARLTEAASSYASKVLEINQGGAFFPGWLPVPRGLHVLSGDGWILAGDAAGLCDPLFGEGIYFALRSGQLAAQCAVEALVSGDLSPRDYSTLIRREFQSAFRWQRLGRELLMRWPRLAPHLLTACPHIRNWLLDYMDDFQSWRGLRLLPVLCLLHRAGIPVKPRSFSGRPSIEVTVERYDPSGWSLF